MMKTRYRIVTDAYLGYQVEWWRWYWPFWCMPRVNTFSSLEQAEKWAREHGRGVVKYLGVIE